MSRFVRAGLLNFAPRILIGKNPQPTLKKVCEKGYAKNQNSIVSSTVKKSEVQEFESRHVIDEAFSGSLPNFLTAFFSGKKISNKEAEELKKLIDGYKE